MNTQELSKKIEAVLFYKNEPMKRGELARILRVSEEEIAAGVDELINTLNTGKRGITLVSSGTERATEYSFATSSENASLIESMVIEELQKDLSPASLETLAIITYKGLVTRKEIEYIRGVNVSFSLRNLTLRGLIERESSTLDERIFLYKPSTNLLLHLGISSFAELPDWNHIQEEMAKPHVTITE